MEKKKYLLTRYNFLSKNTILLLIIFIFTTFILPVYAQKETICSWCDTCNYCQYIGMEIKNDYVTINVNFGINIEKYPDLKKLTVIIPNKFESLQLTQEKNKTGYVVAYSISYPDVRKEYDVNITPINDMTKAIFDLSPGCLSYYRKNDCQVSFKYSLKIPVDEEGKKTLNFNPPKIEEFTNIPTQVRIYGILTNNTVLYSSIKSSIFLGKIYEFETSNPNGEIDKPITIEWREQNILEKYVFELSQSFWHIFIYAFFLIPSIFLFGHIFKLNNLEKLKAISLSLFSYVIFSPFTFRNLESIFTFFLSPFYHIPLAIFLSIWFKPKYSLSKTLIISVVIASVLVVSCFLFLVRFAD